MADNLSVTQGTGTTIAADDVGGVLFQRVKPAFGADGAAVDVSTANPLPVDVRTNTAATAAGENFVGKVGGVTAEVSANFTRPADTTAYASGDLVANSTTAGSVTPLSFTVARVAAGSGSIRRARIKKSGTSVTNTAFRLHLFAASPTVTNGDNGALLTTHSGWIGSIDVNAMLAFSDAAAGNGTPNSGSEVAFKLASGQVLFGLLEARGAYTPTSAEVFTITLETYQD